MPNATLSDPPLLLTIEQAAELLGLSRSSIYRLIRGDELGVVRFGRSVRIRRAAIEQLASRGETK